jgi:hypothetical protein
MSVATVKAHVSGMPTKLGVDDRVYIALLVQEAREPDPRVSRTFGRRATATRGYGSQILDPRAKRSNWDHRLTDRRRLRRKGLD